MHIYNIHMYNSLESQGRTEIREQIQFDSESGDCDMFPERSDF